MLCHARSRQIGALILGALSIALQHPAVELLAVTTVFGSTSLSNAIANVARTLRANRIARQVSGGGARARERPKTASALQIPIYRGAEQPLRESNAGKDSRIETAVFGADGLSDVPRAWPEVSVAVRLAPRRILGARRRRASGR